MPSLPPAPTFIIIGAQKSATRWLRSNLAEHPDIYASPDELEFFNHNFSEGMDWYRARFEEWSGEPLVGESTPGYLMWKERSSVIPERMRKKLPDARLVAILRNPVDRAHSALVHHLRRERLPEETSLMEWVRQTAPEADKLKLIAGGWYARSLEPFIDRFGDQLLVLIHDDIADDAIAVYQRALVHLRAASDFVPPALSEVRFSNQATPAGARNSGPRLGHDDRVRLHEFFADDIGRLEKLIGRELSIWDP